MNGGHVKVGRVWEDYVKLIYQLQQKNGVVTNQEIAEAFGVKKSTTSEAVTRLVKAGYVTRNSRHEIGLTPEGEAIAKEMCEHTSLLLTFLQSIGVSKTVAEEDACLLEHTMSRESFHQLKMYMRG